MLRYGRLQIDTQSVYAILGIGLLLFAIYRGVPIPYIGAQNALYLAIVFLLARAFLPDTLVGYLLFVILLGFVVYAVFPIPRLVFPLLLLLLLFGFLGGRR